LTLDDQLIETHSVQKRPSWGLLK